MCFFCVLPHPLFCSLNPHTWWMDMLKSQKHILITFLSAKDIVIQQDDEIRLKIVGTRVDNASVTDSWGTPGAWLLASPLCPASARPNTDLCSPLLLCFVPRSCSVVVPSVPHPSSARLEMIYWGGEDLIGWGGSTRWRWYNWVMMIPSGGEDLIGWCLYNRLVIALHKQKGFSCRW